MIPSRNFGKPSLSSVNKHPHVPFRPEVLVGLPPGHRSSCFLHIRPHRTPLSKLGSSFWMLGISWSCERRFDKFLLSGDSNQRTHSPAHADPCSSPHQAHCPSVHMAYYNRPFNLPTMELHHWQWGKGEKRSIKPWVRTHKYQVPPQIHPGWDSNWALLPWRVTFGRLGL